MKTLDKGQDKIKKICEVLREETLEPAKKQGEQIVQEAHKKAEKLLAEAQQAAAKLHEQAKAEIEQIKSAFEASLAQAAKQSLEMLKQAIETRFFNQNLSKLIDSRASSPDVIAALINAIVQALKKEGTAANLTALIPKEVDPQQVIQLLLEDVVKTLKQGSVEVGTFNGGAQVKLKDKNMTIDITDYALKDLLTSHIVRKEFRKLFFESG